MCQTSIYVKRFLDVLYVMFSPTRTGDIRSWGVEGDVHNALIELLPVGRHLLDTGSTFQVPHPEHTSFHLHDIGSNLQVSPTEHTSFHLLNTGSTLQVPQPETSYHLMNTSLTLQVPRTAHISRTQVRLSRFHTLNTQAVIYRTQVKLSSPGNRLDSPGLTSWTHKLSCPRHWFDSQGSTQPEHTNFRPWTQALDSPGSTP
jgi:hypothetical protein